MSTLSPDEICRRLGEERFKEMFHLLTAKQMKEMLGLVGIPTARLPSHTSTKKRNDDWAARMWRAMPTGKDNVGSTLLYQWLTQRRNAMMSAFLDGLGVPHKNGLTDEDFYPGVADDKLLDTAQKLIASSDFDKREVAAYLLFLDMANKSERLAPLKLAEHLPQPS